MAKSGEATPRKRRKIGYAVVGLGHIAQQAILPAFANAKKNCRLVALVSDDDNKRKELGAHYGVEKTYSYQQYEQCLKDEEVDAVYIALPNTLHAEYTERAAAAGVHVLCEKPMATSEDDCQRMIKACQDASVRLMIAYRLHFEKANLEAVGLVQSGKLGEPRFFASEFSYQVSDDNIRTQHRLGGGPLWDIGIYCVNAARYLFQAEPIEVFAHATRGKDPRFQEVEESVSVSLMFPDQRLASFICSYNAAATATYRVVGTHGDLRLDGAYEYQGKIHQTLTVGDKTSRKSYRERDQFAPELISFSNCILNDQEPEPSGLEGLADVRILRGAFESISQHKPVALRPVERIRHPQPSQEMERPKVSTPFLVHAEAPQAN